MNKRHHFWQAVVFGLWLGMGPELTPQLAQAQTKKPALASLPSRFRYELLKHDIGHDKIVLFLRDHKTGRNLWKRRCYSLDTPIAWSGDHQSLAFSFVDIYEPTFRGHPNPPPYQNQFRLL